MENRVTLTGAQLKEVLKFVAPDRDNADQLETEVTIAYEGNPDKTIDPETGHQRGPGYYAFLTEYPEEGSIGPL